MSAPLQNHSLNCSIDNKLDKLKAPDINQGFCALQASCAGVEPFMACPQTKFNEGRYAQYCPRQVANGTKTSLVFPGHGSGNT